MNRLAAPTATMKTCVCCGTVFGRGPFLTGQGICADCLHEGYSGPIRRIPPVPMPSTPEERYLCFVAQHRTDRLIICALSFLCCALAIFLMFRR